VSRTRRVFFGLALASVAPGQDAPRSLLENGSFEEESPLGWSVAEGAPLVLRVRTPPAFPGPVAGSRYLGGGRSATSRVTQAVPLAGGGTLSLRGHACSGLGGDTVRIELVVTDAGGNELQRAAAPVADRMDWAAFQVRAAVPAGAVQATVVIQFTRVRGEDLNAFVDALSLEWLDRAPASQPASREVAASGPASGPASAPAPVAEAARPGMVHLLAGPALYNPATTGPAAARVELWWEADTEVPLAVVAQVPGSSTAVKVQSSVAPGHGAPARFVHRAALEGLEPGARYRYTIERSMDGVGSFRAPPGAQEPFVFAVVGDNQEHPALMRTRVLSRLLADQVMFLVHAGDLVGQGDLPDHWRQHWYAPFAPFLKQLPVLATRGNHDGESPLARQKIPLPGNGNWYAATCGCVRFLVLDSNLPCGPDSEQLRWLAEELRSEATRAARWRVALFHHPPWTNTWDARNYDGEKVMREHAVPLLEGGGGGAPCDLVFSGHAHCYNRGQRTRPDGRPVFYVISGGGGGYLDSKHIHDWPHIQVEQSLHHYLLVDVSLERIRVRALASTDRRQLDEFTVR
jgi:predicted phosphodiesterase